MTPEELKARTKAFAVRIVRVVETLPQTKAAGIMVGQLLRAGTSVGAKYRSACRARSTADFLSRMGIVEEECDESMYWMELLIETKKLDATRAADLYKEAEEILKIVVASIVTARSHSPIRNPKSEIRNGERQR